MVAGPRCLAWGLLGDSSLASSKKGLMLMMHADTCPYSGKSQKREWSFSYPGPTVMKLDPLNVIIPPAFQTEEAAPAVKDDDIFKGWEFELYCMYHLIGYCRCRGIIVLVLTEG